MKCLVNLNLYTKEWRLKLFIFLSLFFTVDIQAQQLEWAKKFGGTGYEAGNCIVTDVNGNVFSAGKFTGNVDFNPGTGVYNLYSGASNSTYVSKLNPSGNFIWAKMIGTIGSNCIPASISVDVDENIYVLGSFSGTVDFDPSASTTFNLGTGGGNDLYLCKLNSMGDFVWAKKIGGTSSETAFKIILDEQKNMFIVGSFNATVDFDLGVGVANLTSAGSYDGFVLKLDSVGDFVWVKKIGGLGNDYISTIGLDKNKNICLTGWFEGTADFDPGIGMINIISAGYSDAFICQLDSLGNYRWASGLGSSGDDSGGQIVIDSDNNIYTAGSFRDTVDFDPSGLVTNLIAQANADIFISKLDSAGNFIWAKRIGDYYYDTPNSMVIDPYENIYITGSFIDTIDFDPNAGIFNLNSSLGGSDIFIVALNKDGNFLWAKSMGGPTVDGGNDSFYSNHSVLTTGSFEGIGNFNCQNYPVNLNAVANYDAFVSKNRTRGVFGFVFNDVSQNCVMDSQELTLAGRYALITPGNIIVETGTNGSWYLDSLPSGNYNITFDVAGPWVATCSTTMSFVVSNPNSVTYAPNFGMINTEACPQPVITIVAPFMRRCFSDQLVYVRACNLQTTSDPLVNAYAIIKLDSLLTPTSTSLSYTNLGNNQYRFNVGTLNPGQRVNFTINTTVSCAANLQQTLCMEARLFPTDSCVFDTIPSAPIPGDTVSVTPCNLPWDRSSLSVDGYCANDTVYFTITNNGSSTNGNMQCQAPVRVYVDDSLMYVYPIQLAGGQTITYSYPGNGQTWILQADQHPLHPGNSHPNAHVEACGDSTNWTPNLVNNLPLDDADPIVDIYCGVVSGAYDPNDKIGFPTGLGTEHEILPNQQLQYLIRFQNTGTDTAFNIVVRDTLDTDLNIFSVVPGVASNNYSFRMYGPRVLEWTFNNIMLPDSNVNEVASHGFLTFTVNQQPNLPNGTKILNDADIYFDFNVPVITNETVHTINNQLHNFAVGIAFINGTTKSTINVFPNPTKGSVYVELKEVSPKTEVTILNVLGQQISKQQFYNVNNCNLTIEGEPGVYFIKVVSGGKTEYLKLLKL